MFMCKIFMSGYQKNLSRCLFLYMEIRRYMDLSKLKKYFSSITFWIGPLLRIVNSPGLLFGCLFQPKSVKIFSRNVKVRQI